MKITRSLFLSMLVGAGVNAQDVKVAGTVDQVIKIPSYSSATQAAPLIDKPIRLLKIELSAKARQQIDQRVAKTLEPSKPKANEFVKNAKKVQLGMGNVPVLDQGGYGSCVTFATTAALDAALNKGDYISQLCSLQLGRYLEENAYIPSGWEGTLAMTVFNQLGTFGFINKTQQKTQGCGGVTEYPISSWSSIPGSPMPPTQFHQLSEEFNDSVVSWTSVLDIYQVFLDDIDMSLAVEEVKAILNAGDRLTFGVLLPDADKGIAGAVGKHHVANDSWVVTPEIIEDMKTETDLPGHEMVITGYDDDAVATDSKGRTYKGLFTLRNSWGTTVGDKGNFYMSYDYYKALVIETMRVRHLASS